MYIYMTRREIMEIEQNNKVDYNISDENEQIIDYI